MGALRFSMCNGQYLVQIVQQITFYHRITGWICHWRTTSTVPQESEILPTTNLGTFVYKQNFWCATASTKSTTNYILSRNHLPIMPLAHYIYGTTWEWNSTYFYFRCVCLHTNHLLTVAILPKVILHAYKGLSSIKVPKPGSNDDKKQKGTRTQQESLTKWRM